MLKHINKEEFNDIVLKSDKVVLVDFFATWCGPCKMLAPVLEKISKTTTDFDIAKIDIDDNQELAYEYGVEVVPTLIVFKNGEIVGRMEGYLDENSIISEMSKYLDA